MNILTKAIKALNKINRNKFYRDYAKVLNNTKLSNWGGIKPSVKDLEPYDIYMLGKIEEIEENMPQPVEQVQSDWNQNDESAPDYIKNRICIASTESVTIYDGNLPLISSQEDLQIFAFESTYESFEEEKFYDVILNSNSYHLQAAKLEDFDDNIVLLHGNIFQNPQEGDFAILFQQGYLVCYYFSSVHSETCYLKLTGEIFIVSKKISPQLLEGKLIHEGSNPTAECFNTASNQASGYCSHAEGDETEASGDSAHAEGRQTTASGFNAHTEGSWTVATEFCSHAEGRSTQAEGRHSHTEGNGTIAVGGNQHVFGTFNVVDTNPPVWVSGQSYNVGDVVTYTNPTYGTTQTYYCKKANSDTSFKVPTNFDFFDNKFYFAEIVGNGTSSSARSNARTLDWQGNEQLAGTLRIGSTSTGGALLKCESGSLKVSFDNGTTWKTVTLT